MFCDGVIGAPEPGLVVEDFDDSSDEQSSQKSEESSSSQRKSQINDSKYDC